MHTPSYFCVLPPTEAGEGEKVVHLKIYPRENCLAPGPEPQSSVSSHLPPRALTYLTAASAPFGIIGMFPPPPPLLPPPGAHCVGLESSCPRFTGEETEFWEGLLGPAGGLPDFLLGRRQTPSASHAALLVQDLAVHSLLPRLPLEPQCLQLQGG